uniref:Putative secreted protein n=1 Tax=Anopheles marajoara TaxID=58244 RepID=A0A2M4CF79_9DIPT
MLQLLLTASRPHIRIVANKRLVLCVLMISRAISEVSRQRTVPTVSPIQSKSYEKDPSSLPRAIRFLS